MATIDVTITESNATPVDVTITEGLRGPTGPTGPSGAGDVGWGQYSDSTYTAESPLVVNDSRVKVTINGLGSSTNTSQIPASGHLWNTSTNKIIPGAVGDAMSIRLNFKATNGGSTAYYDMDLDIGGSLGTIVETTKALVKGVGVVTRDILSFPVFIGSTFLANGGEIYIDTSISGDSISFWDFNLFVQKTYEE